MHRAGPYHDSPSGSASPGIQRGPPADIPLARQGGRRENYESRHATRDADLQSHHVLRPGVISLSLGLRSGNGGAAVPAGGAQAGVRGRWTPGPAPRARLCVWRCSRTRALPPALRAALPRRPRGGYLGAVAASECGIIYGSGRCWFLEGQSSQPLKTCSSPLASRPREVCTEHLPQRQSLRRRKRTLTEGQGGDKCTVVVCSSMPNADVGENKWVRDREDTAEQQYESRHSRPSERQVHLLLRVEISGIRCAGT